VYTNNEHRVQRAYVYNIIILYMRTIIYVIVFPLHVILITIPTAIIITVIIFFFIRKFTIIYFDAICAAGCRNLLYYYIILLWF